MANLQQEKRRLREKMQADGLGCPAIAAELARIYDLRPRAAWRQAHGWGLEEAADRINEFAEAAGPSRPRGPLPKMARTHLSEYETWPGRGSPPPRRRPTPYVLALIAAVYDCAVIDLIDRADREHLPLADLLVLDMYGSPALRRTGQA